MASWRSSLSTLVPIGIFFLVNLPLSICSWTAGLLCNPKTSALSPLTCKIEPSLNPKTNDGFPFLNVYASRVVSSDSVLASRCLFFRLLRRLPVPVPRRTSSQTVPSPSS